MPDRHPPLLVALDVETTGFGRSDRIIEVAAVRFLPDGTVLGRYQSLVDPERLVPARATEVHGITDAMLVGAPPAARVLRELTEFIGPSVLTGLVGHNLAFDKGHLLNAYARANVASPPAMFNPIDTLGLARRRWPGLDSYKLGDLAGRIGYPAEGLHRAAADADVAMRLWLALAGGKDAR